MAFFGLFNYDKPGPGVSKDEPKKAAPIRFFEIFWRKLSKLIQLNLIFMIPLVIVAAMMVGVFLLPIPHFAFFSSLLGPVDLYNVYAVPFPMVFLAPFTAGMAYVTRNFAREEHAFVWSDFWDAVKSNWKASLLNGLVVYVAYVVLSFSFLFYANRATDNLLFLIPLALIGLIALMVFFAQFYIPVMIVTFDLKLRHIYKNALIFSIMGVVRNFLITLLFAAMFVGILFCPASFLFIPFFLMILILFSFISYLCSFATYSLLDQFLIQPFYSRTSAEIKAAEGENFSFEADELDDEDDSDTPKYVYVNGRLIEKRLLKEESLFSDESGQHLS